MKHVDYCHAHISLEFNCRHLWGVAGAIRSNLHAACASRSDARHFANLFNLPSHSIDNHLYELAFLHRNQNDTSLLMQPPGVLFNESCHVAVADRNDCRGLNVLAHHDSCGRSDAEHTRPSGDNTIRAGVH